MKTDHKHVIRDLRLRFLMAKLWKKNFFYILIININLTKISLFRNAAQCVVFLFAWKPPIIRAKLYIEMYEGVGNRKCGTMHDDPLWIAQFVCLLPRLYFLDYNCQSSHVHCVAAALHVTCFHLLGERDITAERSSPSSLRCKRRDDLGV